MGVHTHHRDFYGGSRGVVVQGFLGAIVHRHGLKSSIFYENIRNAIEEVKGTILMVYNSSLAICTGHFHDLFRKWRRNPVSCLYFYNNDDDLASVCPEFADGLVAVSKAIYNEIALFPHIKKIEVPVDFKISLRSLLQANY